MQSFKTALPALAIAGVFTVACSSESTTGSTTAGTGGSGAAGAASGTGANSTTGGSGGIATGSTSGTSTGTGGGTSAGNCPTGDFSAENQVLFDGDPINTDTVWTKDKLYIVKEELKVSANLTIQAGTTVCFQNGLIDNIGRLTVAESGEGSIQVLGTPSEHVTFTATDTNKGWGGIMVYGSSTQTDFAYADFFYSSRPDSDTDSAHYSAGGLRLRGGISVEPPPARLDHVTFFAVKQGGALWVESDAGLTADSTVEVKDYNLWQNELKYTDSAVLVSMHAAASLKPGMIVLDASLPESKRGVEILRTYLTADSIIPVIGLTYFAPDGLFISADSLPPVVSLTISPGVDIWFGSGSIIQVGAGGVGTKGNLIVDGTAAQPVKLAFYNFPGSFSDHWGGLFFKVYEPAVSRVSYAVIQGGGSTASGDVSDVCGDSSSTGAIMIAAPSLADYAAMTIDHTTIDGSATHGIVADCSFECIDSAADYTKPELGNVFMNITGKNQILSTCPP